MLGAIVMRLQFSFSARTSRNLRVSHPLIYLHSTSMKRVISVSQPNALS
jgi:hypothetical protein